MRNVEESLNLGEKPVELVGAAAARNASTTCALTTVMDTGGCDTDDDCLAGVPLLMCTFLMCSSRFFS